MKDSVAVFLKKKLGGKPYRLQSIQPDGSDRRFHRVYLTDLSDRTYVLLDHVGGDRENDSFFLIGSHLQRRGIPVPDIHAFHSDGLFLLEDLGDEHLYSRVSGADEYTQETWYKKTIDLLILLQKNATQDFLTEYCFDTPYYDRFLALEREGRYFHKAFLEGYVHMRDIPHTLDRELRELAARVENSETLVFLHRDFQSRNLMLKNEELHVIDFQGARLGPPQYDLAALVWDPYVDLSDPLREKLVEYYVEKFQPTDGSRFQEQFFYVGFHRSMQVLGAFGFLTKIKGKPFFKRFIPGAVRNLSYFFRRLDVSNLPGIKSVVKRLNSIDFSRPM